MSSKFLAALVLFLVMAMSARAQMADREYERPLFDSVKPAALLTRSVSSRLHLNEGQYVKLCVLNRIRQEQEQQAQHQTDPDMRLSRLVEARTQYEQECSRILTPEQFSQLREEQAIPATAWHQPGKIGK